MEGKDLLIKKTSHARFIKEHGLPDMDRISFKILQKYLFTGTVPGKREVTWALLKGASKFKLTELEKFCSETLLSKLNIRNAMRYLMESQSCEVDEVKEAVLHFAALNVGEISQTPEWKDLKKYPEKVEKLLLDIVLQLAS